MSEALYLEDSYLRECEATVQSVKEGKYVVLDRTVFYPRGGGQPNDTGKIVRGDEEFAVVFVGRSEGRISHEVDRPGLNEGDKVRCVLDWERRHRLMRMHTAAHVLSATMNKELGVLITGNQLGEDKTRFDFSMEEFDRGKFDGIVAKANDLLSQDLELRVYDLPREEAMKIPGVVKLANALPPSIKVLRMVEIPDIDVQADGGTHVKNLNEVGKIDILKLENKGKSNRRIYFTLM
jgi:misacylated tRNA(Ala) deacylase